MIRQCADSENDILSQTQRLHLARSRLQQVPASSDLSEAVSQTAFEVDRP